MRVTNLKDLLAAGGTTCANEALAIYIEGHCPGGKGPLDRVNERVT